MATYQKCGLVLLFFTTFLFTGIRNSNAQEMSENKFAFKTYLNLNSHYDDAPDVQFGLMSAAISKIMGNGNFQEFELSSIGASTKVRFGPATIPQPTYSLTEKNQYLRLRYEYSLSIFKKTRMFNPYIGASFSPYFYRGHTMPSSSFLTINSSQRFGIDVGIVPRVQWNLRGKWFLDLNTPVTLNDTYYSRSTERGPAFMGGKQTSYTFGTSAFVDFSMRLGVGIKL